MSNKTFHAQISAPAVNRIELIDQDERVIVLSSVSDVRIVRQDDNRTLKLFLRDNNK